VTGRACIGQEQNIIDTAAVKWASVQVSQWANTPSIFTVGS